MLTAYYILPLGCTALLALALAAYAWRERHIPAAPALACLALSVAIWVLFYAFELDATDLSAKVWWAKLQYLGIVSTPVAWLIFARQYAGHPGWPSRRLLAMLLIIPLITLGLVWTNELHLWFWHSTDYSRMDSFPALKVSYGAWFWVHAAYCYLLMTLGSISLLAIVVRGPHHYRPLLGLLLFSALVPWLGNALYLARIEPPYPLDLTPFAFALSALALGWSLLRFGLLDIAPVARIAIFRDLHDGVIVLNTHNQVLDLNLAAQQILGQGGAAVFGRTLGQLLPEQTELLALAEGLGESRTEITIDSALAQHCYDVHISPLLDPRGQLSGRLIMLHEITERKRAEEVQRFLAEASDLLAASLDYETTLVTVARLAVPRLADWCLIHLLNADQSMRRVALTHADPSKQAVADELQEKYPLDSDAPYSYPRVMRTGQPELIPMVSDAGLAKIAKDERHLELLRALGFCSTMSVPLIARGRTIGAIVFASAESHRRYGEKDLLLATELARRVALAADNTRLFADLRASEHRYRALIAHAADAIVLTDLDGRILDANEHASKLLGYTRDELLETQLVDLLGPQGSADLQTTLGALQQGGRTFAVRCKDRTFRPIEVTVGSFTESDRRVFIVIMRDISQRKMAESRLHRQNAELMALHETTLGLINRLEVDRLLESLVMRAGALLDTPHGYLYVVDSEHEELVVRVAAGIFADRLGYRLKRGAGLAGRVWEIGQALASNNYRSWPGRQLDLDELNLHAIVSVPIYAGAEFVGVLGLAYLDMTRRFDSDAIALLQRFADMASLAFENARLYSAARQELAERRLTEEALRSAEADLRAAKELAEAATRAKSEFLAHMSHEMRTPVSSMIGMTELLGWTQLDIDQREMVDLIRIGGNTLLALLNNFLNLAKIESGKIELEHQPYDLQKCIEEAIDLVSVKATAKGLDLAYALDPRIPWQLIGDYAQLRQILVNLLSNAIKFTNTGGIFIAVDAGPAADARHELHFSVADTGIGISPDQIEKIFAPYQQLDAQPVRYEIGTGLGLAISKRLSELMGGRMWLESSVGIGSTFHFTIVTAADTADQQEAALTDMLGRRILIVADQPQTRQALSLYAQYWGLQASVTDSAGAALEWLHERLTLDAAVIDLQRSDIEPATLAMQLRQAQANPSMPVILLAPLGRRERQPVVDAHTILLRKPLKLSQLLAALRERDLDPGFAALASAEPPQPTGARTSTAPLRVLLAEDDRANRYLALRLLEKLGCYSDMAGSGQAALAALEREHYDILLLDGQLPDVDGIQIARTIRERWPAERQPYMIAITANATPGAREQYLSAGVDDYISKPLNIEDLSAALARYHRQSHTPGQIDHVGLERVNGDRLANGAAVQSERAPLDAATIEYMHALFANQPPYKLQALFKAYSEDTALLLNDMCQAVQIHDAQAFRQIAHKLKSSSEIVGAKSLAELAIVCEQAADTAGPREWQELIQRIEAEFARVHSALQPEYLRSIHPDN